MNSRERSTSINPLTEIIFSECGQTLTEYAVIIFAVVIVCVAVFTAFGQMVIALFQAMVNAF